MIPKRVRVQFARYGVFATIAVVLLAGFRLYSFSYFWLDDFNNVYWIRREGFWNLIKDILNPSSVFFRPLGMLGYWIVFRLAGLHPLPYHLVSWSLHALNTALLFLLLRRATRSHYAAGLAVLFFAFRTNFNDIYWSFANIFQLLAFALVLTGMLLYMQFGDSLTETVALLAVYVLAIRAEEQAVLLPVVWLGYEVLIRRREWSKRLAVRYITAAITMGWFAFFKITSMQDVDVTRPYYMSLTPLTFGRGYGWYFNSFYQTNLRWGGWFTISAVLAIAFAIRKNWWALYFLGFAYLTMLPYVFLVNHRFELYSYMAFAGVAGLLALGFKALHRIVRRSLPPQIAFVALSIVFVVIAARNFRYEEHRGRAGRGYLEGVEEEYRSFFHDLQNLPRVATSSMLYFTTIPRHMDEGNVLCSTQFALNRTDIETKVVSECPPEGICVAFRDGHLNLARATP